MKTLEIELTDEQCDDLAKIALSIDKRIDDDDQESELCQIIFDRALVRITKAID